MRFSGHFEVAKANRDWLPNIFVQDPDQCCSLFALALKILSLRPKLLRSVKPAAEYPGDWFSVWR
jgi:hypothetical protein